MFRTRGDQIVARTLAATQAFALLLTSACSGRGAALARDLEALSPDWVQQHRTSHASILGHALAVDAYVCEPTPARVFFAPTPAGVRTIQGSMPHYDLYEGPMRYQVRRAQDRWLVEAWVVVEPPELTGRMELPDCQLAQVLDGPVECSGQPYSQTTSLEICPAGGSFSAPVTRRNVQALLGQWSEAVERYYNRDAAEHGLPVRYDFTFTLPEARPVPASAALVVPLATSCARTPYFEAVRSGWSLPILAHEMGHLLGLLDEYEMLSGIVGFYPKAPFEGAERSRMGLSMREGTKLLPMHHYLVLRRYFCPEPMDSRASVRF